MWINIPPRRLTEGLIKGLGNCFIAGGVHFSAASSVIIVDVFAVFKTWKLNLNQIWKYEIKMYYTK